MQLTTYCSDQLGKAALDCRVHVLIQREDVKLARVHLRQHLPQPGANLPGLRLRQYTGALQRPGPGQRAADIRFDQPPIEGDRVVIFGRLLLQSF